MSRKTSVIPRKSGRFRPRWTGESGRFRLCKLRSRDRPTAAPAGSPSATTPPGSPTPTETALFRLARACCWGTGARPRTVARWAVPEPSRVVRLRTVAPWSPPTPHDSPPRLSATANKMF